MGEPKLNRLPFLVKMKAVSKSCDEGAIPPSRSVSVQIKFVVYQPIATWMLQEKPKEKPKSKESRTY